MATDDYYVQILDQAIEAARASTSETTAQPSKPCEQKGWRKLRLDTEPTVRFLDHVERSIATVDEELVQTIRELIRGEKPWPLTIWGTPGSGKTCAALALCDYVDHRLQVWYETLVSMARHMSKYLTDAGGYQEQITLWGETCELVVLDEISLRAPTDFQFSLLLELLDARGRAPMIVISNSTPKELREKFDDRVVSRLMAGTVFELTGIDRRIAP